MKRCFLLLLLIASSVKLMAQFRIVGGSAVDISQRPYQAAVFVDGKFNGGGVIISSRYILTAAHVVNGYSTSRIMISVGHTNLNLDYNILNVSKINVHEKYFKEFGIPYNDVAVICLSEPLNYNSNVQPISLSSDREYVTGLRAIVSGWGRINPDNYEQSLNQLQEATVTILSSDYQNVVAQPSSSTVLHGDSGGPLTIKQNGTDILIGLVSWGFPQDPQNTPSYYVNVGTFKDWILKNSILSDISLTGPTQICNSSGTFRINNLPAGTTVQWSKGTRWDALQLSHGQGTAQATYSTTGSGQGTVTATVSYLGASITLSHTVQVGTPAPSIYGPFQNGHVMAGICACQSAYYEAATAPGITRYHWEMVDDSPYISLLGNKSRSFPLSVNRDASFAYIRCKQYQEGCGWSEITEEPIYFHDNCCRQWGIGPNPTPGPIELRSYRASDGEASLMRTATPTTTTLRHVQVFSSDGRLVLEQRYPTGTPNAQLDLSPLRPGTYHLLINGTEHHVVVRE